MKTINIREAGEPVYFLSNKEGFIKGKIKRTFVESVIQHIGDGKLSTVTTIKYYVTCDQYNQEYVGDEKFENDLFETKEDMIQFYLDKSK